MATQTCGAIADRKSGEQRVPTHASEAGRTFGSAGGLIEIHQSRPSVRVGRFAWPLLLARSNGLGFPIRRSSLMTLRHLASPESVE
jgi:hypothetical protein